MMNEPKFTPEIVKQLMSAPVNRVRVLVFPEPTYEARPGMRGFQERIFIRRSAWTVAKHCAEGSIVNIEGVQVLVVETSKQGAITELVVWHEEVLHP